MIIGAHIMLQSKNEPADKAFFSEVLKFAFVDAGNGFLIFGAPPTEIAVHESNRNDVHQLYLMCDDVAEFAGQMKQRGIACTPPRHQGWGTMLEITLPGGGKLGVYQPHHARPEAGKPQPKATAGKPVRRKATRKAPPRKRTPTRRKTSRRR